MKKKILFLILLSLLITAEPSFAKDPALVNKGYNYINKGYIKNALPTFQKAVKQYPNNVRAHYGLALSAFKQGGESNIQLAIEHYQKVLQLDPNNLEAKKNLARILSWKETSRPLALNLYREYLAAKPNDKEARFAYAETLNWAGNSAQAAQILSDLYKNQPKSKEIALTYANALAGSEQYYTALPIYQHAIKSKYKFDNYTSMNYARTLMNTGYSDTALDIFNDVLKMAKTKEEKMDARKELASAFFNAGQYRQALSIDQAIEPKDKVVLLRMARANEKLGNTQEAIQLYESLYNTYPYDLDIKRSTANFLGGIGGYTITASKIYEEIISEGNATLQDKINLAKIYNAREASRDQAIALYREILADPALTEDQATTIKLEMARALASNETTRQQSIQMYRDVLANNPADLKLKTEFLEVLSWQENTRREALLNYYDLIQKYPANSEIQKGFNQTLVWYLPEKEDLALYEEILEQYPNNPNALKGLAYIVSQNPEIEKDVISIFKQALASDPQNTELKIKLADALTSSEETREEGVKLYREALQQEPSNLEIKVALANNLLYEKDYKQARDLYEEIIQVDPANKDALLGRARIFSWQGLNLAALKAYSAVYDKYPNDPDIAYEYAAVAKKLGNNAKALKILRSIQSQSYLPEAPVVPVENNAPVIAMAIDYQVLEVDNSPSGSILPDTQDIEKLQNDLSSIQAELEALQKEIKALQQNAPVDNYTAVTTIPAAPAPKASQPDVAIEYKADKLDHHFTYSNESQTHTSQSPFTDTTISSTDSLPDPVKPSDGYTGRVYYSPTLSVLDEYETSSENEDFSEIVYNSDSRSSGNIFRVSGFEDALSGRRYAIMEDQFGQLEKDLMYLMRPELRTSFILSNEAGNPTSDALEIHGYPSFMSFNITPQNRFRFGISSITYGMDQSVHPASITATSYTMGLNSRPHERVLFDGELAINSFSDPNAPVDVTANADLTLRLHDRLRLNLGYRREPLFQSVLETTGYTLRPQYSPAQLSSVLNRMAPFAGRWVDMDPNLLLERNRLANNLGYYDQLNGPFMGQVRDNAINAELTFLPFNKWDVSAGYEYSAVRGENIENNGKHQAFFSFGRTFTGVKDHLFRLGYQFLFFGYRKDLSGFPNMTPYPYDVNGRNLPVTRQMPYEELNRYLNDPNYPYVDPRIVYDNVTNGTPIPANGPIYSSPVRFIAAPEGVGIGGYFSPTQFYLNSFRLDFEGKLWDGRVYYKGGGSLGVQQIGDRVDRMDLLSARHLEQFANIPANDPRLADPAFRANARAASQIQDSTDPTSLASAFDFTLFFRLTDYLTVYNGVDYMNTGAFDRWRYNGGLIFRPKIDILSPIFRKPKQAPVATPEEEAKSIIEESEEETYEP
jgi:tetratricopeptide (TPR) repeat protein